MCEQVVLQTSEMESEALRLAGHVVVVQESANRLTRAKLRVQGGKGRGDAKGKKSRHQGITLLPALRLQDPVGDPIVVSPDERGGPSVEQTHKGQKRVCCRQVVEGAQHGLTTDQVERPNAVNRQRGEGRIKVGGQLQAVHEGFGTRTRGQSVLEGVGGQVEVRAELLCKGACNKPPQEVAHNNAPDAPSGLTDGNNASQPTPRRARRRLESNTGPEGVTGACGSHWSRSGLSGA